ncbi:MAG: MBOAT family protein [Tannerella sp.]|jgi:D-alanyl-lipoteichoic acid acyltransferase DltB (MBOAT superfamily)|nr:MBOAT family protein [Tannerella sp.]
MDINFLGQTFSIGRLGELFLYRPEEPLLFSTGFFFFLFTGFFIIFLSLRKHALTRIVYITLFSLYFYYKTSGLCFLLLLFTATSDFLIAHGIFASRTKKWKKAWVALSVCINLGMLSYFKYTGFLYSLGAMCLQHAGAWLGIPSLASITCTPVDIFLPIGISFFTFQSLSYTVDVYRGRLQPLRRWIDYLFYISFFPGLVAGPIVRARDFIPQMYRTPVLSRAHLGEGLYLIICGLLKKCVISDYLSLNLVDRVFDAPTLYTGVENLLGVYGYALQIYCDFSGYSDMAIGIALWLGIRFRANFDSPYQSATITEFWRRWHISLSTWLKDYLYIPLGGNRKGRLRTYVNLMVTMLLGGLWHGAAFRFVLWGGVHGLALTVHKWMMKRFPGFKKDGAEMTPLRRVCGVIFTFHLVCFGWIFFRADSIHTAFEMLGQIFTRFYPDVFAQFVKGYPAVFLLMLGGYLIHFIPKRFDLHMQQAVARSPLILQILYLTLAVFLVAQVKSAGIVPFIYFQF